MRHIILLIAVVAIAGCGKKTSSEEPETNAVSKTGLTPAELADLEQKHPNAFVNSLGIVFKPVPGTEVQFCIWETRVKDYTAYARRHAR